MSFKMASIAAAILNIYWEFQKFKQVCKNMLWTENVYGKIFRERLLQVNENKHIQRGSKFAWKRLQSGKYITIHLPYN